MEESSQKTPADDETRNRKAPASFGDGGTTATANAYGHLIQISRYFGNKPSGFFCVDLPSVEDPFLVSQRIESIQRCVDDPRQGIGLKLEDNKRDASWEVTTAENISPPSLSFAQNRWPCFTTETPGYHLSIEYFVEEDTVYQKYVFRQRDKKGSTPRLPRWTINAELLIRNLDFITATNEGNEMGEHDDLYGSYASSDGHCVVRIQQRTDTKRDGHDAERDDHDAEQDDHDAERDDHDVERDNLGVLALFVTPFVDSRPQNCCRTTGHNYRIKLDAQAWESSNKSRELEITLAYTLDLVSSAEKDGHSSPVSQAIMRMANNKLMNSPFEPLSFTNDSHLDFVIGRNLEHILSVCSIPVTVGTSNLDIPPIALTCGDLAGHRVSTAASFYAFEFLLQGLDFLQKQRPTNCRCNANETLCEFYACKLRARIWSTCRGHLAWVCAKAEKPDDLFAPHYWVDGKVIDGWQYNHWLTPKSLVDAPLQFIKVGEFARVTNDEGIRAYAADQLKTPIESWVRELDRINRNREFAFPRSQENGTVNFHFVDHVFIWRALKAIEGLKLESSLQIKKDERNQRSYASNNFQHNILKRFTTENLNKRAIAVTRNSFENRYLLHAKDTAIFYAMELGLFDRPGASWSVNDKWQNKIDVWRNTIDCQKFHEDNPEAKWNKPLRFALAIITSTLGRPIITRIVHDMYEFAKGILLRCSSSNGLFPGSMDDNRNPVLFNDELKRDAYWHVTFEIPYMLWKYFSHGMSDERGQSDKKTLGFATNHPTTFERRLSTVTSPDPNSQTSEPVTSRQTNGAAIPTKASSNMAGFDMKRSMPFNNVIDQTKVVELVDEWIYNKPSFFHDGNNATWRGIWELYISEPDAWIEESELELYDWINDFFQSEKLDEGAKTKDTNQDASQHSVERQFGVFRKLDDEDKIREANQDTVQHSAQKQLSVHRPVGVLVDVPEAKRVKRSHNQPQILSDYRMKHLGKQPRTSEEAKKRFLWLFDVTVRTASIDCLISSEPERKDLSAFFNKHASYDNDFFEGTTAVLNKWVTELHLSFYQLLEHDETNKRTGIPTAQSVQFPDGIADPERKWIQRAIISFRFDGDIFDRYWTCHFVQYTSRKVLKRGRWPDASDTFDALLEKTKRHCDNGTNKKPWRQRRVLELILFDTILDEMTDSTKSILVETKRRLKAKSAKVQGRGRTRIPDESTIKAQGGGSANVLDDALQLFSRLSNDAFLSTSNDWQKYQQILQVVEENLEDNLGKIKLWKDREGERGPDKPRWTRNDERRYRSTISKLLAQNNHKIQELQRCHASITSLNISLTRRLEIMRSDLELRGAGDIRLFTYVTVVFLPIGFATGVYSMNSIPTKETLISMIITAAVALAVTIIALILARVVRGRFVHSIARIFSFMFHRLIYHFFLHLICPLEGVMGYPIPEKVACHFFVGKENNPVHAARQEYKARKLKKLEKQKGGNPPRTDETKGKERRSWQPKDWLKMLRRRGRDQPHNEESAVGSGQGLPDHTYPPRRRLSSGS